LVPDTFHFLVVPDVFPESLFPGICPLSRKVLRLCLCPFAGPRKPSVPSPLRGETTPHVPTTRASFFGELPMGATKDDLRGTLPPRSRKPTNISCFGQPSRKLIPPFLLGFPFNVKTSFTCGDPGGGNYFSPSCFLGSPLLCRKIYVSLPILFVPPTARNDSENLTSFDPSNTE